MQMLDPTQSLVPDKTEEFSIKDLEDLETARKLINYLGATSLPRELIDDRDNLIDPETRSKERAILAHFREDSLFGIKTARFLKDFYNYQCAPDLKTTNTSFLRTAELFRQQGIKNYYFILQLNNPLLVGVDPYDPELPEESKMMVLNECRENFWYFLREVCKLNPNLKFRANRANISFIWNYLNHVTSYNILPRQQGKLLDNATKVRVTDPVKGIYWKAIGELKIGDNILDREGNVRQVTGVHPGGLRRLYKLKFSDGRTVKAGAEHLWSVILPNDGLNDNPFYTDVDTATLIKYVDEKKLIELPLVEPVNGVRNPPLDPYLVGTSLVREVEELSGYHMELVPYDYLETTVENKVSLLNGLLDNLERINITKEGIDFRVYDDRIFDSIPYLVRSLGGTCKFDRIRKVICLSLPKQLNYFRERILSSYEEEQLALIENRLYLESITYVGKNEATCIEVNSEDELYIVADFILTHNTVSVQVIDFWLTYIMGRGYNTHLITLKSDNRVQFINAIKRIRSSLPSYLINSTYKDKDAGTSLSYKAFGEDKVNTLTVSVPQIGEDAAGDLGRGLTIGTTNIDEPAYINWIEAIVNGCMPSALTEMANMRTLGLPHGISYITTPNTTLHPSGEYMFKKLMSATEWREKFFDSFNESHLKERLIKASPVKTTSPSVSAVYNYLQLGKDKDWVRRTIDELGLSISKAKIDLLLQWQSDGEHKLLDEITRDALINVKKNKVFSKEYDSGLFLDFFISEDDLKQISKPDFNDHFLVGVDTSAAINKDACTVVIRSFKTGVVVGVGRYPIAFLNDVHDVIVDILITINNSLLVIERNYAAHMIDQLLITLPVKGLDPFVKIYNTIYQDTIGNSRLYEEVSNTKFNYRSKNFYLKFKQHFGFNTTASSRSTLYNLLQEAVAVTGYGINYDKLIDELTLLEIKNDRIDHGSKGHDDLVVAWLLSYWFIKYGQNMTYYGINSGLALTQTKNLLENSRHNKEQAHLDPNAIKLMEYLKEKIETLTEELLNTDDNLLALRIEAEISKLSKMLPMETRKVMTIERTIENANLERRKRRLQNRR